MNPIDALLKDLKRQRHTDTVFNPYRTPRLVANLRVYLNRLRATQVNPILLVGEAPGFKGCKYTGIPFSSGELFRSSPHPFIRSLRDRLDIRVRESENTATMVWDYLLDKPMVPVFWNAFPYHPHRPGERLTNRSPNKKEVEQGGYFLRVLQEIFEPTVVAGVGRKGMQCAEAVFPDRSIQYIRHPSFGGKMDFVRGMDDLLRSLSVSNQGDKDSDGSESRHDGRGQGQ